MYRKNKTIKTWRFILAILILFIIPFANSKVASIKVETGVSNQIENYGQAEVIIKLRDVEKQQKGIFFTKTLTDEEVKSTQEKAKEELKKDLEDVKYEFSSFNGLSASVSREELEKLEKNSDVELISSDHQFSAFLQDSAVITNATRTWIQEVNGTNITGIGETICLVDTGVNYSHPDLGGCFGSSCKVIAGFNFINEGTSPMDDNGHGTHIAGISAGNGIIKGIAPDAKIVAMKVLDSTGNGGEADLIAGIEACIGNASLYNISVISLSLGTTALYTEHCDSSFPSLSSALNLAISKNISVIAAAGNGNNYTSISSPSCISNVTAVGNVNKQDSISYNRNKFVQLLAPGTNINSTYKSGYTQLSGTSMSAPHIAASFMLVRQFYELQNNTVLTPKQIQDTLNKTGKQIYDSSSGLTFSRVDIIVALQDLGLTNILTETIENISITLISPQNNLITKQQQSFSCLSNSTNQLKDITFSLYDSSSLVYRETKNITNTVNTTIFSYTGLADGTYTWNCLVSDTQNYSKISQTNSLIFDSSKPIFSNYLEPSAYSSNIQLNVTITDLSLNMVGIQLNNTWTDFNYSASNLSNVFMFNLSLGIGNYSYYWWANDSLGHYNTSEIRNFTIIPAQNQISLASSSGWSYYSSSSSTFSCTSAFGTPKLFENDIEITNPITATYSAGAYTIKCNVTGNENYSSAETSSTLTVSSQSSSSSDDSGSSSSNSNSAPSTNPEGTTYVLTTLQSESGATRVLAEKDKIKFPVNNEQHLINLTKLNSASAEIRVSSKPQEATLFIDQPKKFELTGDSYYDIEINLDSVSNNRANITITKNNESVEVPEENIETNLTNSSFASSSQLTGGVTADSGFLEKIKNNFIKIAVPLIILISIILIIAGKRNRKNLYGRKNKK